MGEEQEEAVRKLIEGRLGWWGKGRMVPRKNVMGKSIQKILLKKMESAGNSNFESALQSVRSDLDEFSREGLVGKFWSKGAFESVLALVRRLEEMGVVI